MGERTEHAPGTFSWTDLSTSDQEAAKQFYSELFGWTADDRPIGDGIYYSMQRIDGKDVCAISPQQQEQRDAGVPPTWNSYVTVESADAAASRAEELGGTVHAPPFDVFDSGRMAVLQDPQGAFFMVWQPNQHIGAGLVNAPGALCWNELATTNIEGARSFYGDLFGWSVEAFGGSEPPYFVIRNGERSNGGMRELDQPGMPPHWFPYFAVEDIDAAFAKVESLGGRKLAGPIDFPAGKIGVAQDPQGAVFALWAGMLED